MQRRTFVAGFGLAGIAACAWAQRPAHPIARPPRPGLAVRGRFDAGGVASGPLPGLYVVAGVDAKAPGLQLRDESGRTEFVLVNEDIFDVETLKPGDEVEVDFLVPQPGSTRLEAGGVWKVQR